MGTMLETANDINRAIQGAARSKGLDTKHEVVNNVYPLMISMLESIDERFQELEGVVAEMAESNSEIVTISPEVANKLQTAFSAADAIAQYAANHLPEEHKPGLIKLIATYQTAVQAAADAIRADQEAGLDEDEDEEDEGDDSDEEGDDLDAEENE
jgi:hypothetical protein